MFDRLKECIALLELSGINSKAQVKEILKEIVDKLLRGLVE